MRNTIAYDFFFVENYVCAYIIWKTVFELHNIFIKVDPNLYMNNKYPENENINNWNTFFLFYRYKNVFVCWII